MSDVEKVFIDIIIAIEGKRGDVWTSTNSAMAVDALDELEDDIRAIASKHGVNLPEPAEPEESF